MTSKGKRVWHRILAVLLVVILSGGVLYTLTLLSAEPQPAEIPEPQPVETPEPQPVETPEPQPAQIPVDSMGLGKIADTVSRQKAVDDELLRVLASDEYPFASPYVQLDPYGESPLTAIVLCTTDTPSRISVHVPGDTPNADVDFTFDEYTTRHAIPVLGLYPNRANSVTLTAITQNGAQSKTVLEITTEPLPDFLKGFVLITETLDENACAEGLNFPTTCQSYINYPFAFDCNGAVRWYLPQYTGIMEFFFFRDTEAGFFLGLGDANGDTAFLVINTLGKVSRYYYSAYGSHHDLYETDHDSWIVTGCNPDRKSTILDVVYEMSTVDGSILHKLDFLTVLERTRAYAFPPIASNADWLHMNAVVAYQDDVIVSSNFQSAVLRIGWDGQLKWMLTDPAGYLEMYDQYMLTPIGEDFEWPYNQHAVELMADQDGNPDTVDLLLFDNGTIRSAVNEGTGRDYSRLVQYRIDEKNRTVEQIWAYGKERPELFSTYRGDANLLPNGNVLGTFSIQDMEQAGHAVYLEVNRAGEVVWECLAQSLLADNLYATYRCERMNIYTKNILDLHLGEAPEIYIPDSIWQKYGIAKVTADASLVSETAPPQADTGIPASDAATATATATGDSVWQVTVESAELLAALRTDIQVLQYEGGFQTVTHENMPSEGMQYALFNLTVSKKQATKSSFDWEGLTLVLADGSAYPRAGDTFLSDHGYARISGTKLTLSTASGYACFEIPADADLAGAVLQYAAEEGTALFAIP